MCSKQVVYKRSNVQSSKFSAETYVGNWYEETIQNTLERNEFISKRECEELFVQKSQIMADILLKPVHLTERRDGYLYFGDSVQIISPGPDCATTVAEFPFKTHCNIGHLALSASVPPTQVNYNPYLNTDSLITSSMHLFPVVRNSFVIERADCEGDNDNMTVLQFGDVFRIRAMPTQHWPLYLHSSPGIPLHAASIHSARPLVRFSDTKNPNTLWRLIPLDPMDKLKMELGIPVPLKTRMVLQHALSGHNLSIEPDFQVLTYFGCEFEVTVHTKQNRVKQTAWANQWVIDTERGWRKPDPCSLAQAKFSAAINVNDSKSASEDEKEKQRQRQQDGDDDDATNGQLEIVGAQPKQGNSNGGGDVHRNEHCIGSSGALCDAGLQELHQFKPKAERVCEQTPAEFEHNRLSVEVPKNRLNRSTPGQVLPFDWRTGPQPHAEKYHLNENQRFYTNMKWNCGDTQCCYNRGASATGDVVCPPRRKWYDVEKQQQ